MIQSIAHKGLRLFYEKGNGSKLPAAYLTKIALVLDALDAVTSEDDIMALGMGIHRLTGNLAGFWAVKISPNYRIAFRFHKGDIYDVTYLDYH
jgi:proteic killer suppression protein